MPLPDAETLWVLRGLHGRFPDGPSTANAWSEHASVFAVLVWGAQR